MPRSPESADGRDESNGEVQLTGIRLDLVSRSIAFEAGDEVVARIRLAPHGVIFHADSTSILPAEFVPQAADASVARAESERVQPVTLQGRLKSTPRPGRPDRNGKPTAWARFAAHEEESEGAHMYSTTFHRHTVEIALSLAQNDPLTVQGYPHEADDPGSKRMDTLSVINLLDYPGKPAK